MLAFQNDLPGYLDRLATSRPLVLWGHSLGGPICAAVASKSRQVDAVILETTAPSFADIMEVRKPWFTPPTIQLELVEGLKTYDIPAALAGFNGRSWSWRSKDRSFRWSWRGLWRTSSRSRGWP